MEFSIHTDLAIEAAALSDKTYLKSKESGIETNCFEKGSVTVTEVNITNENGAKAIGKPIGRYITIEVPEIRDNIAVSYENAEKVLTEELKKLINLNSIDTVMVVGLGNRFVTPDALGPKVVDKLLVTRHLKTVLPDEISSEMHSLCAVAPGVLGITGMETLEIIQGVSAKIKPDMIIAIDALASRKTSRISTTFQISNTGITPGSGIGNKRQAINEETLGIPVIAIGVPTVIEAVAVANDAIDMLIDAIKANASKDSSLYKSTAFIDNEQRYELISELLSPSGNELIVTPKEVDSIIDEVSGIIADSINTAINGKTAQKLGNMI